MKVGDILTATDPCIMSGSGLPALTVGKKYIIIEMSNEHFIIKDDKNVDHWYMLNTSNPRESWERYFVTKEGSVKRLLQKIDEA